MAEHREPGHALVFGASGLLGWSVVNQLLSAYPAPGCFSDVTAVFHRPASEADLCLPEESAQRPALHLVSGVDLRQGSADGLARQLADGTRGARAITHVFYFVFSSFDADHVRECEINCAMMRRVADAVNVVAPELRSFVYSGGTRGYGIYAPGGTFTAPLREELADQLPEDYARTCAYPWFRQILTEASRGRGWAWTEVCPDAVIGFSPNGSAFSLALHWAQYLSLYAFNNAASASSTGKTRVSFPGCRAAYDSKCSPVSGPMLGRISIHAALHPDTCGGRIVNMADQDMASSFSNAWPAIASWFGLEGVGPAGDDGALKPGEYVAEHGHVFEAQGRPEALKRGVGAGSSQLDAVGWWLTFDRHLSLDRLRGLGFDEQRDPVQGWLDAFERFRAAGIIL